MFYVFKKTKRAMLALALIISFGAVGLRAAVVDVATKEELAVALEAPAPGTTIRLASGEWRDLDTLLKAQGEADAPVVLEAKVPGEARLTGRTSLRLEGRHLIVRGLHFDRAVRAEGREALISLRGADGRPASDSRLTDLYFDHCNPPDLLENYPWIRMYGHRNRVDHSRFEGQAHKGLAIQIRVYDTEPAHRIDHNHFLDRLPGAESNGYEVIQVGLSGDSMKPGNVIIEDNIFERCDGETEIISSKSFSNIIRRNLFLESSGSVTLRHGDKGQVLDNAFIGNEKPGSGGVRVVGSGNVVSGNYFSGLTGRTGGVVVFYCGIPDSPLNGYFPASGAVLENNIFHRNSGNAIYLTGGSGQRNRILLPQEVRLAGNVFGQPANGGTVAIAGHLPDLALVNNVHDSGMETGLHTGQGLELREIVFRRNEQGLAEPIVVDKDKRLSPQPLLKAPRIPTRDEVGPRWFAELPALLLLNPRRIEALRQSNSLADASRRIALINRAEAILEAGKRYSVTFNDRMPPSGDIRDYYSTGPYWWPNPETADGLPYIRIDGKFNPERDRVSDREPLHSLIESVRILAVAQAVSGREAYGKEAAALLDTWFLDDQTGMNPNLQHAQAIPGVTVGRGTGIIDTHPFAELVDAIRLLEEAGSLSASQSRALGDWFADFTEWLLTSENGRAEADSLNNHGTAYDLQAAALLWFTGQDDRLADYLRNVTLPRIGQQITPEGLQPHELSRTRTWSYCTENLEHFFKLGLMGRSVGVDLFGYAAENGASLQKALNYLLPHVCEPDAWPHPQETAWQNHFIRNVLSIASGVYASEAYATARDCLSQEQGTPFADLLTP